MNRRTVRQRVVAIGAMVFVGLLFIGEARGQESTMLPSSTTRLSMIDESTGSGKPANDLVAVWYRSVTLGSLTNSFVPMLRVIEVFSDGRYISGICGSTGAWCTKSQATAVRPGTYAVRGQELTFDLGLMDPQRQNQSAMREVYQWSIELHPAASRNPPLPLVSRRTLHLIDANSVETQFFEMPPARRLQWVKPTAR